MHTHPHNSWSSSCASTVRVQLSTYSCIAAMLTLWQPQVGRRWWESCQLHCSKQAHRHFRPRRQPNKQVCCFAAVLTAIITPSHLTGAQLPNICAKHKDTGAHLHSTTTNCSICSNRIVAGDTTSDLTARLPYSATQPLCIPPPPCAVANCAGGTHHHLRHTVV